MTLRAARQVGYLLVNRLLHHPLIIFDKDLTLVGSAVPGRPANTLEEQALLPDVGEICALLVRMGYKLAIASNQGGVAYGFMSHEQATALVVDAAQQIDARYFMLCPHHPKGTVPEYAIECNCRKPKPGMILELLDRFDLHPWQALFVGDMDSDREAAARAGVDFMLAKEFFGWEESDGN